MTSLSAQSASTSAVEQHNREAAADGASVSSFCKQEGAILPYRPFPISMELYANWNIAQYKTWHIRETGSRERLFAVQIHSGMSGSGPLSTTPGTYIYNGPKTSDSLLAAIGDESLRSAHVYAFNSHSVMMLPPAEPTGTNRLTTTKVVPRSTEEHGATFQFTIEVGHDLRKETFEWRKLSKGDEDYAGAGGYKLVLLPRKTGKGDEALTESTSAPSATDDGETVAVVTFISLLKTFTHALSLRLVGNAAKGVYCDRCVLAIVLTAVRLYMLRMKGRTSHTVVKTGEKVHGKPE